MKHLKTYLLFILFASSFSLQAADFFWVNGSGNWSDFANHWRRANNTAWNRVPSDTDNVIFNSASFTAASQTVTVDIALAQCKSMNWTGVINNPTLAKLPANDTLKIFGSLIFAAGITNNYTGNIQFKTTGTDSLRTNGIAFVGDVWLSQIGEIQLKNALTINAALRVERGTFKSGNFAVTAQQFDFNFPNFRNVNFGTSVITVSQGGNAWIVEPANLTLQVNTATLTFNYTGTDTIKFNSGGQAYNYNIVNVPNALFYCINTSTFTTLNLAAGATVILEENTTQNYTTLNATGSCGLPIIINSSSENQAKLSSNSNTTVNYWYVKGINKIGTGTFTANNTVDEGNNTNITITAPTGPANLYWIGGNGNWYDPARWSTTSGGTTANCVPSVTTNVFFDANSFSGASQTVTVDYTAYCNNITWTGSNAPNFSGSFDINIRGNMVLNAIMNLPFTGTYNFYGSGAVSINTFNRTLNGKVVLNNATGNYSLASNFTSIESISLLDGSLNTANFTVSASAVLWDIETNSRSLSIGNSTITLTGNGDIWKMAKDNFTFSTGTTSKIICASTQPDKCIFTGADKTYVDLLIQTSSVEILDSNTFKYVFVQPGSKLAIESEKALTTDSLRAIGTCATPIILSANDPLGLPATIRKTGANKNLTVNFTYISNIIGDISNAQTYNANNSVLQYTTTNWVATAPAGTGDTYYWIGRTGNWNNVNNWSLTSGGVAAGCLPTILDTVVFDANSFNAANQVVTVNVDAFCNLMTWATAANNPRLNILQTLTIRRNLIMNAAMSTSGNRDGIIRFLPLGNNCSINTQNVTLNASILMEGSVLADQLQLQNNLTTDDSLNQITIVEGTFVTNNRNIVTGSVNLITGADKQITLGSSIINLRYGWNALGITTGLTVTPGTSQIIINGDKTGEFFNGAGKTYYDLSIFSGGDLKSKITASNSFRRLTINSGVDAEFEAGTTQTTQRFRAIGTCTDSISLSTSVAATQATITQNGDSIWAEAAFIKDMVAAGTATKGARFSTNGGNNTGWTFPTQASTTANFTYPATLCRGTAINFTNTSTAANGNINSLTHFWQFGDGDTSVLRNPSKIYGQGGRKGVTLTTTYTNGCKSSKTDSIIVNDLLVQLESSSPSAIICAGESITFRTLDNATTYQFFRNNVAIAPASADTFITVTNLANNDSVYVIANQGGCAFKSNTTLKFTVNPVPTPTLTSSDSDNIICAGDRVKFTGSNATEYLFYLNGNPIGFFNNIDSLATTSLVNGDIIRMQGKNSVTGCVAFAPQTFTFTVNAIPNVSLLSSDGDNVICAGESVTFTASGASQYQFTINNSPQGAFAAGNTFTTTAIQQGNTVRVVGRTNGCTKTSNGFTFAVNPLPTVTLTNTANNNTLCDGDDIIFTASGANAYEFFINGTSVQGPQVTETYSTTTLNNGDVVTVEGQINGCINLASPNNMIVNNVPNVNLLSSDVDNIICLNENVTFTASGASTYELFIGGASQGVPSTNNIFNTTSILNGQNVSVVGYQNGCSATSNNTFTFTVKQIPLVSIFSTDFDNIITRCEPVNFTALGASTYEFFVSGASQGAPSITNTFASSTLQNNQQVYVRGIANGCPAFSDTLTYTVNNAPQVPLNTNTVNNTICSGNNVIFATSGADEYEFYVNGNLVQGRNTQITYSNNALQNGDEVYVLGYTFNCPTSSDTLTFTVNQFPVVTLSSSDADNTICRNDAVTFTASGATNYEFFVNGVSQGASSPVNTFTTSALLNNQNIRVRGTTNGCSTNSSNINFTVIPQPNISLFSSDLDNTICQGDAITFTALGGIQYEFFVDGVSQGVPSNTNTFNTTSLPVGIPKVSVIGTQGGCSNAAQDTFDIQVVALPTVTLVSSDLDNTICDDDTVTFTASGASQYRFFINNVSQGNFSANNTFVSNSLQNGQTVRVSGIANGCLAQGTPSFTFTVNANPNTSLTSSDIDRVICNGDAVTFTANGATLYEFFIDGVSQGALSNVNQFSTSSLVDSTRVRVSGVTNGCATSSASLLFRVNDLPVVTLTSSDSDNSICAGDNITFNGSGATLYQFMVNGNPLSNPSATATRNIATLTNGQTVSLRGINQFGCQAMATPTYTITVNQLPIVTLNSTDADNQICTNESVTFTANGALQYQFYIGNNAATSLSNSNIYITDSIQNAQTIKVLGVSNGCSAFANATYTYLVNVFPAVGLIASNTNNTICEDDSITFKASGANQYEFFIDGISLGAASAVDSVIINSLSTGQTVSVKGYNNNCISNSVNTFAYTVTPLPNVTLSSSDVDNRICYGTPVTFTASGAVAYEYFINNLSQGTSNNVTYTNDELENGDVVTVLGFDNGCSATGNNNYTFIVDKLNLNVNTSTNTGLVCSDADITITATGANAYEFFVDGVSQGASSANNSITLSNLNSGSVVTVAGFSNITNCTQEADATVTINVLPEITLSPANDTAICEGDTLFLNSSYEKGNEWFKDGVLINGETQPTLAVTESGVYNVSGFRGGDGNIWTIGRNTFGQIGDSSINSTNETYLIPEFENLISLEAGLNFNIACNNAGKVWAWGSNNFGQLGDGTFADKDFPLQVPALNNIKTVAAGDEFALALTNAGKVWSWGKNDKGQLGQGNTSTQQFPFEIGSLLTNATQIAAGAQHSLALKSDSTVVAWGDNQYGQLGNGNFNNRFFPTAIQNFNKVVAIAAGSNHSLAIKEDGTVWVWGNNANGQLGKNNINFSNTPIQITGISDAIKVVGGEEHTLILTADGRVYAFGGNDYGQLGDSTTTTNFSPKKIKNLKSVKNVFAGPFNSFAIKTDGSVHSWGINTDYQLALTNNTLQIEPQYALSLTGATTIAAGIYHTAMIAANKVACQPNPVTVTVNPVPNAVVEWAQEGLTTNSVGVSYQWYYNGIAIPNGTQATLPTQTNGEYQVAVTNAQGCTTLSEVYSFTVGIESKQNHSTLWIYPNPSNRKVFIKTSNSTIKQLKLLNVLGEVIQIISLGKQETAIDVSTFADGLYFIETQSGNSIFIDKFIVSK